VDDGGALRAPEGWLEVAAGEVISAEGDAPTIRSVEEALGSFLVACGVEKHGEGVAGDVGTGEMREIKSPSARSEGGRQKGD
jgi:hypothetical protein